MKYYWTTKDGRKIDVDEMDIDHLRNTLKMILRNINKKKVRPIGNIESNFLEEQYKDWENDFYDYDDFL